MHSDNLLPTLVFSFEASIVKSFSKCLYVKRILQDHAEGNVSGLFLVALMSIVNMHIEF